MFGILTLISLSLKNKTSSKNLCLVKFEVLGNQNTKKMIEYHFHIRSQGQFKQVCVREKNEINSGGSPRLIMHLVNHLVKTSGYPFWY